MKSVHVHGDYEWIEEPGHDSRVLEWVRVCACGYSPDRPSWRVLVTGSRKWIDDRAVWRALFDEWHFARNHGWQLVVIEGQCPSGGADLIAEQFAATMAVLHPGEVYHDPIPAKWKELGKRAGMVRNQVMVDRGADVCLAFPFPDSVGTFDCARRAEEAGIPVKWFEVSE